MEYTVNTLFKNAKLVKTAYLGLVICALGGLMQAGAQDAAGPPKAASESGADEELVQQVTAALRADPTVADKHIEVSVERGNVVLRGFVLNDSDRRNALRIAREASEGRKVVDNIELNQGGR